MLKSLCFVVTVALAGTAAAQTGGAMVGTAPGKGVAVQTVKATATITAIDKSTRDVTLKGPQGREMTVMAGPDARSVAARYWLDQVEKTVDARW